MSGARLQRDGAFRFHVEGEMTFATASDLLRQSAEYFDKARELEIDLSRVSAGDSAGLALLLEWKAMAVRLGGRVAISEPPEALRSIARLCRIETLLQNV